MNPLISAALGAMGTYLLITSFEAWRPRPVTASRPRARLRAASSDAIRRARLRLQRGGLESVSPLQFVLASAAAGLAATVAVAFLLGPVIAAPIVGGVAATLPTLHWRKHHRAVRAATRECWPRLIEEIRVLTGSVGRPIPQALIEAGLRGPAELRTSFEAAQREWLLTTDFPRTVSVLKERLDEPTADSTCEILLVVHEVGGDPDSRLADLAEDCRGALRDQKEADARQAGARFARWFVIIVPAGMTFAGLSLGDGRSAFAHAGAQVATVVAIAMIAGCWWWAGAIMATPLERRVLDR